MVAGTYHLFPFAVGIVNHPHRRLCSGAVYLCDILIGVSDLFCHRGHRGFSVVWLVLNDFFH